MNNKLKYYITFYHSFMTFIIRNCWNNALYSSSSWFKVELYMRINSYMRIKMNV